MEGLLLLSAVLLAQRARKHLAPQGDTDQDDDTGHQENRRAMKYTVQAKLRPNRKYVAGKKPHLPSMAADMIHEEFRGERDKEKGRGSFRPGWMRATEEPLISRMEAERDLSQPVDDQRDRDATEMMRTHGKRIAHYNVRLSKAGNVPVEPEFIRPPRRGGDEGYDEDRGRLPIPRFHRYDLGPELTTGMNDFGAVRGRGDAVRSETGRGETWEIMPNRDLQAPAREQNLQFRPLGHQRLGGSAFLGASTPDIPRDGISWNMGATGQRGVTMRPRVPGEFQTTDNDIDGHKAATGVNAYDPVTRPTMMRQPITDRVVPPQFSDVTPNDGPGKHADVERPSLRRDHQDTMHRVEVPSFMPHEVSSGPKGGSVATFMTGGEQIKALKFSFHLKDLLRQESLTRDPAKTRGEREKGGRHTEIEPLDVTSRVPLPTVPVAKNRANETLVLFSAEERSAYKHDPKQLDLKRFDLTDTTTAASQQLAKRLGGDGHKTTAEQYTVDSTVNSDIKMHTQERPHNIGDGKRIQDEHRVWSELETQHAHVNQPHVPLPQPRENVGKTIIPVNEHPVEEPRIIVLPPPRSLSLAEVRPTLHMSKKPSDEKPTDASFIHTQTRLDAPTVNYLSDTARTTSGLAKDATHQFPINSIVPATTSLVRAQKKATTLFAHTQHEKAGAWKGASQPAKTLTFATFLHGDAGIDHKQDVIGDKGGTLALPLKVKPHVRDGPQPRLILETDDVHEFKARR